ncbi:hypothetical protein [uncultured Imperialibacter sp.]|uniref:hypothetical protein n=1 Tax=uncultured Imperialibacter sp. TaxID=1672639 RepID=UPI0030DD2764|tara:strand:+ start:5931 stop:6209 length:279 start_codon:yes stop_codon:yes gene_type:complete
MEDWKDKIMNSLEGLDKAQPPANAFSKIQQKIHALPPKKKQRSDNWMAVAAAIVLMVCSNIFFISSYVSSTETNSQLQSYTDLISSYNIYAE